MRKIILLILLITNISFANDNLVINEKINQILKENNNITNRLSMAILVRDLKTGKELYALNPYQRMIPSSTLKSFTTYAALSFLKPDFVYTTEIFAKRSKLNKNGTLKGDLYFKFSGDPSLTEDDLAKLISELKTNNIKKITGKIIIDDSIFDQDYHAIGTSWNDNKFCFAAPISAITINNNCFQMLLQPAKIIDQPANLTSVKQPFINMSNEIVTKADTNCAPELKANPDNSYELTGCIDINTPDTPLYIAYQDPRLMIIGYIKHLLDKEDIKYNSVFVFDAVPSEYDVIATHHSKDLAELINSMHKDSNNNAADNFAKTIAAYYHKKQGNFANSITAVTEILAAKTNIDFTQVRIVDGAGLSRYNLIAPDQLIDLFITANNDQLLSPFFNDSLSVSAIDGTLKKSFINSPHLHGKIRAKTGSQTGIYALVGFLEQEKDNPLVFAIMFNGHIGSRAQLMTLTEQILASIAN